MKAIEKRDGGVRLEYAGLARGEDPSLEAAVAGRHRRARHVASELAALGCARVTSRPSCRYSLVAVYSAMPSTRSPSSLFALDLAKRSARVPGRRPQRVRRSGGGTASAERRGSADSTATRPSSEPTPRRSTALEFERIALRAHRARLGAARRGDVLRGIAAGRVPWANMYEFALTGTAHHRRRLPRRAALAGPALPRRLHHRLRAGPPRRRAPSTSTSTSSRCRRRCSRTGSSSTSSSPSLGTAFFALGAGLSVAAAAAGPARGPAGRRRCAFLRPCPDAERLENLAYRVERRRLRLLDLHPHRRRHLGRARLGPLLGLGHQGGLDLHHLGDLRRLHPRPRDPRLARLALGLAGDHRLLRRDVQLPSSTCSSRACTPTRACSRERPCRRTGSAGESARA